MNIKYRAEYIAEGMWVCVRGDDYNHASLHSTKADAVEAARSKNLWASVSGEA